VTDNHERWTQEVVAAIGADYPGATVVGHVMDVGNRSSIDQTVSEVGSSSVRSVTWSTTRP
jgi:hypothetical protein